MQWIKKGLIFCTKKNYDWMQTHAQIPTPIKIDEHTLRIFFCARDSKGRSLPTYIDVDADSPQKVLKVNETPLLSLGQIGAFDDSGIMPTSVVKNKEKIYLYYTGWNPRVTTSYDLAIGLSVSEDDGYSFKKYSNGPIMDRTINDSIFVAGCYVMPDNNIWKMWYLSCTSWKIINNRTEPVYLIKYAESFDGIEWKPHNKVCIDYKYDGEALGRPWVIKENNIYKMWYATRGSINYRLKTGQHYNIGYSESLDGINWLRMDEKVGIKTSENGWDSEMITYCSIFKHNNNKYMFYNGNGFGKTGFGYAVLAG